MALHVFDSNIWIRVHRNHPPDIFVNFWGRIDGLIRSGELQSPEEVLHELDRGTDDLAALLRTRDGLFVPLTEELQGAARTVMQRCSSLADPDSERNRADPFVVALALLRGGMVVTDEGRRRADSAPLKIPDACDTLRVPWCDWFGFLRGQNWPL